MVVTLQQIADAAGVDKATASRILSGKGQAARISQGRIDRVLQIAERLKFRKNVAAQAMNAGRLGVVDLVLSRGEDTSHTPLSLQLGIHDRLTTAGLRMQMSWLRDAQFTDETFLPSFLREHRSDGLLLNYTHHIPERLRDLVQRYGLPTIWINSQHPYDCVYPDDQQAGLLATQWLIRHGHRRIAYCDYFHDFADPLGVHYSAVERLHGYRAAMKEAGLKPRVLPQPKALTTSHLQTLTREWISSPDRPEAVVSYGDEFELIVAESGRLGLQIPGDLAVISFSDRPLFLAGKKYPRISIPSYECGAPAVEMLLRKISQPEQRLPPRRVACAIDDDIGPE